MRRRNNKSWWRRTRKTCFFQEKNPFSGFFLIFFDFFEEEKQFHTTPTHPRGPRTTIATHRGTRYPPPLPHGWKFPEGRPCVDGGGGSHGVGEVWRRRRRVCMCGHVCVCVWSVATVYEEGNTATLQQLSLGDRDAAYEKGATIRQKMAQKRGSKKVRKMYKSLVDEFNSV